MKYVILDNIRSKYNVGAIFRTADGAGVDKIYLVGYTPTPTDRFGRPVPEISKTALGAETVIPWSKETDIMALIAKLRQDGVWVVAVEQASKSTDLYNFKVPEAIAYIFGSETEGLDQGVLSVVDEILELPMLGHKESLNVSVTVGVVLYHK